MPSPNPIKEAKCVFLRRKTQVMDDSKDWEDEYNPEELVERFEAMIKDGRHDFFDSDEYEFIIDYYMQNNQFALSRTAIETALELYPNDKRLMIKLARQHIAENNPDRGLDILSKLTDTDDDPDYYLTLGSAYSSLEKHKLAISSYKKALPGFETEDRNEIYYAMAIEYQSLSDYENALVCFKKSAAMGSDKDLVYMNIRFLFEKLNVPEEAVKYFEKEIDRDVFNIDARMALASEYSHLQLYERAIDEYEFVLAINPEHKEAYYELCSLLIDNNRIKDAFDNIKEAFSNNVDSSHLRCLLGDCYAKAGDTENAFKCYRKAIEMDSGTPDPHIGLGFLYSDRNEHQKAIECFKRAFELELYNPDILYYLVEEYNKIEDYEKSLKYLKELEKSQIYEEDLYIYYMDTFLQMDDADNAIRILEKGLNNIGDSAPLYYRLAYVYLICNEHEAGLAYLNRALDIDTEGADEFIDLNPEFLKADNEILQLIHEHKNHTQS